MAALWETQLAQLLQMCMKEIEERALENTASPPKVWDRYFDDLFSNMKKNAVSTFQLTSLTQTFLLVWNTTPTKNCTLISRNFAATIITNVYS